MPAWLILHKADALALDSISEDDYGLAYRRPGLLEHIHHLIHVVSIDAQNIPSKAGVLRAKRFHLHHVFYPAVDLKSVAVDDGNDVVQTEMAGFHGRFPNLAFLLFSVAHQAKDFVALSVQSCCQRHAYGDAQTLTQRSRGNLNTRQFVPLWVTLEGRTKLAQRNYIVNGAKTREGQSEIEARSLVAGRPNNAVAVWPGRVLWIVVCGMQVKRGGNIHD